MNPHLRRINREDKEDSQPDLHMPIYRKEISPAHESKENDKGESGVSEL
jgi:hypothetical protein